MSKKLFTKLYFLKMKRKAKPSQDSIGKTPNRLSLNLKGIIVDLMNTRSILLKLVAVFLLLIILPVSTIGFISANTASESLKKNTEDSVKAATKQTAYNFDVFLDKAQNISMQIAANSTIQEFNKLDISETVQSEKSTMQQKANEVIRGINAASAAVSAKVIFFNGSILGELQPPDDMGKVLKSEWCKMVQEAKGKAIWIDYGDDIKCTNGKKSALSLARLYMNQDGEGVGIVLVDVNYSSVSGILSEIDLGKNDVTYMITKEGKVLSAQYQYEEDLLNQRKFIKEVKIKSANEGRGLFYIADTGTDYLVSFSKSANSGLTAVTIVPDSVITEGAKQIRKTTIIAGIIFVLLAGAFGFVFSIGMTLALKSIMGAMSNAEDGDLTSSLYIKRKDEIGKLAISFNRMVEKIRELVMQNKQAAEEVVVSSRKMASISAESSRISTEIAHAIVEVASGSANQASEIESSVKNVSQLADRISQAAEKTIVMESDSESMQELSNYGSITIGNLSSKAAETNEITLNVVKEISQLNQYVKNINVITNILRSIADQTNLLALNAAIEAARAGDAGKGFAVVADEIRKLAEQSNTRTREIQKHIENIFKQAQSSTDLVGKAETSIKEQNQMVTETAEVFSRINEKIATLVENINIVDSMITDMDSYKGMVLSSMENISAVSEEVSASTQEVSASTEEQLASVEQLDDMAKQLNELAGNLILQMDKFKV